MSTPLLPAPLGTEPSNLPILRTRTLVVTSGILALVGLGLQRVAPPDALLTPLPRAIDHHGALVDSTKTIVAQQ